MPVPTSLIIVVLVVAWLAVLVPMVARRREKVPEWDEGGARFRVLARSSPRRRANLNLLHRKETDMDTAGEIDDLDGEPLDEELLDAPESDDDLFDDETDADELDSDPAMGSPDPHPRWAADFGSAPAPRRRGRAGATPMRVPESVILPEAVDEYDGVDEQRYRPVPQRHGRGGYDPEAAEATRHFRYRRRRRITAVLVLLTVVFVVAAVLLARVLWVGAAVFGLLLVGYLAYLRRQVRIEEDIRQRRLAKLRRARQIRPEYAFEPASHGPIHSGATPMSAPASAAWSGPGRGRQMVELDDDDPAFDDLENYEPVVYRRASGQ